jgi:hypothetical protein
MILDDKPGKPVKSDVSSGTAAGGATAASGVKLDNTILGVFAPISQFFLKNPPAVLREASFYKLAISEEGETNNLHKVLSAYLTSKEMRDREAYRQQCASVFRVFMQGLVPKTASKTLTSQKQMLMRFATISPAMLTPEQIALFDSAIPSNLTGEPVYYLDEWISDVAKGKLELSQEDGLSRQTESAADASTRMMMLKTRHTGQMAALAEEITEKSGVRDRLERELQKTVQSLCVHTAIPGVEPYGIPLSEEQKKTIPVINHILRDLLQVDSEIALCVDRYHNTSAAAQKVETKISFAVGVDPSVSLNSAVKEMDTVLEMFDILIGRNGNSFPFLTKEFFHCDPASIGFRENVIDILSKIEAIDPNVFCRVHKDIRRRIVPEVLLLPCYGDRGICWYPFSKTNIVVSRGRIVIPMYPKNLQLAILTALGHLRWQAAKAKASYYWMSEGLTGEFYEWCTKQKFKGDPEEAFVQWYILWISKESAGNQSMDRDMRDIFWRYVPFVQPVKERLATRSAVYQDLYRRDHGQK